MLVNLLNSLSKLELLADLAAGFHVVPSVRERDVVASRARISRPAAEHTWARSQRRILILGQCISAGLRASFGPRLVDCSCHIVHSRGAVHNRATFTVIQNVAHQLEK